MEKERGIHPRLESEIIELSHRLESGVEAEKKPEIIREFVNERVSEARRAEPRAQESVLPEYSADVPANIKLYVERIIDGLWHDGDLRKAAAQAEKGGELTLDLFHDILTGKMSEELKNQGLIQ